MIVAKYAMTHKLYRQKGWEWVSEYIQENPVKQAIVKVFKILVEDRRHFKFGVEVPRNPKHALELDRILQTNGWKIAMEDELDILHEYQMFKVILDNEPIPKGYKRIPYHIGFLHDI